MTSPEISAQEVSSTPSQSPPASHAHHPHHAELVDEAGHWKYTNALADETSPYLLQHAHNPVDWRPWGPEAFELARQEQKPIFLSIGYSTCYWCHVMERQVFENPRIAAQMNEQFVNIKVDREQRPDIDEIYMTVTQLVSGSGGWPMSVFLTPPSEDGADPGLKPFFAGTYFPPEPMRGMPSFPQVLDHLHKLWQDDRAGVMQSADKLADAVVEQLGQRDEPGEVNAAMVQQAANVLLRVYDPEHGGFGGAPKFPTPVNLAFLMAVYEHTPNPQVWDVIANTLDHMARGGVYDQIAGGFHRYSVDEKWRVPHFEKMLYDNAQLLAVYAEAQRIRPSKDDPDFYADTAKDIFRYIERDMVDDTGAFLSAQDAEVDGREGGNYVWTAEQVEQAIGDDAELAALALHLYGLDQGPNFRDPHAADAPQCNVLYLPTPVHALAAERGESLDAMWAKVREIDARLLVARDKREQPATDDKVLTAWNGAMIAALAKAGRLLDDPAMTAAAETAANAVIEHMIAPTEDDAHAGRLYRSMRDGRAAVPAFLEDYAWFIHAMIELHRTTGDARWLDRAKRTTGVVVRDFACPDGGYFDTLANQADLFVRTRNAHDGAIPCGNSVMVNNLLDLYEITHDPMYLRQAVRDLRSFSSQLDRHGVNMLNMQIALLRALTLAPPVQASQVDGEQKAQPASDPHVAIAVTPAHPTLSDGETTVTLTLTIQQGVHVNAHQPGDPALLPLQLSLVGGEGVTMQVTYPDAQSRTFAFADQPVNVYEGRVTIKATLHKQPDAVGEPKLVLTYQACDERTCYEPQTYVVELKTAAR